MILQHSSQFLLATVLLLSASSQSSMAFQRPYLHLSTSVVQERVPGRLGLPHHTTIRESNVMMQMSNAPADPGPVNKRWAPLSLQDKILLPLQIMLGIHLLLLLPSGLAVGNPLLGGAAVMGSLPYEYLAFFSVLLLPRAYQYGAFDTPDREEEKPTVGAIAAPLAFAVSLIAAHWVGAYQHALRGQALLAPQFFFAIRLLATVLVGASGRELGKSYDRVTEPDELISTGPYAIVRNPIYTSYLLFFSSTLLTLQSYIPLAILLVVTAYYYRARIGEEEQILAETFGEAFDEYKE